MLKESILASIEAPQASKAGPATTLPVVKDAGIYHLELRPHFEPKTVFKKSTARPNCVATSATHVFAAQADKAVVHVYAKGRGNQELVIPLGERVTAIASAGGDGAWVICGMESGAVFVWETYSGRLVKAQQSHVQSVTAIAVDNESKFFVTGSADSTLLVWSLSTTLTYSQDQSASFSTTARRAPKHTLTAHRAPIVGLAAGHSKALSNFVVSIAEDKTAIIWHVASGALLRTYLLLDKPTAITLDPADRAAFVGYQDGTVQVLDFYAPGEVSHVTDDSPSSAPRQASPDLKWKLPPAGSEDGQTDVAAVRCMALSLDGSRLLTGHQCGRLCAWEVGSGRYDGDICILPGSVTNLEFLRPEGLPASGRPFKATTVVKPKLDTSNFFDLEHAVAVGELHGNIPPALHAKESPYNSVGFDDALLWEGIQQLQAMQESKQNNKTVNGNAGHELEANSDFVSLDDGLARSNDQFDGHDTEADFLRQQVKSLQSTQKESFKIMRDMRRERELLMKELDAHRSRAG